MPRIFNCLIPTVPVLLAAASTAHAQLVPTSSADRYIGVDQIGTFTELPGAAFTPTSTLSAGNLVLGMTGDIRMELDPDEHNGDFRTMTIGATQQFTVGTFPTQITPSLDVNYKVAIAGGPWEADYPRASSVVGLRIHVTGAYVNGDETFAGIGSIVYEDAFGGSSVNGNGLRIVDGFVPGTSYVLLPGESYTAVWYMTMYGDTGELTSDDPAAAGFFEVGGISSFDGLSFNLNAVTVPTPGSLALLGISGLVAARRRRV